MAIFFYQTSPLANFNDLRSMFITKKCGKSNIAEDGANLGLTHKCFCIFVTKSSDGLLLAFPTNALFFSSFRIWPQFWATQKKQMCSQNVNLSGLGWVGTLGSPPLAEKFQQSLLVLNTTLYGLWSIRRNWTGNKKQPCILGLYLWPTKSTEKTMLYTQSLAHKSTRLPLPSNQREKFFSATRIQRSPPFTRIQRSRPFLELQGAYLVLEYSSWKTEEPSFY